MQHHRNISRRDVLKACTSLSSTAVMLKSIRQATAVQQGVEVNDMQSQLNATRVARIVEPASVDEAAQNLRNARRRRDAVCVAGGRHAMGGQQFAEGGVLFDMRKLNRVLRFDRQNGFIDVEAGIQWPELIDYLLREQQGQTEAWGIRQKQTGVDRVTLGGSLAANIHGRGLRFPPIVGDVESFELLDASGQLHRCDRKENAELFSLAIGGYGLFGLVTQVRLRLARRQKLRRVVEKIAVKDLMDGFDRRLREGFLYGDCQYAIHLEDDASEHPGVFSCYQPVADNMPVPTNQRQLSAEHWAELYRLTRVDKKKAFEKYVDYYLSTDGQVYWSDTHQLAGNFQEYRRAVAPERGTEMITEVYVAQERFLDFMADAHADFLKHRVDMTYGTIRLIEKDDTTFLAWADRPYVCIVCNLHVLHTEEGKRQAAGHFRRILDLAIAHGGRFYLTYHRWATKQQVAACYPRFAEFLKFKRKYDRDELFQSQWYRHYKAMFAA
jgi:FAD/FMN-containing dehydrogenase